MTVKRVEQYVDQVYVGEELGITYDKCKSLFKSLSLQRW